MEPPNRLGAGEVLSRIRSGALTCTALMEATLEAIRRREPEIHAWAALDEERAIERAMEADRVPQGRRGPLHGLPIGVKDNFDTADFPTEYGGRAWLEHRPTRNASVVQQAISEGAIVVGKTVTTEYALREPSITRNPHATDHTPGGSSSGSAAAVAACMISLALGSQTNGSVLRPASYCGVYGYKPTFGLLPRSGLAGIASSLDTVGVFSRDLAGLALAAQSLSRAQYNDADDLGFPMTGLMDAVRGGSDLHWKVGFCRTPVWGLCEPDTRERIEEFVGRLKTEVSAVEVDDVDLPAGFERIHEEHMIIQDAGVARSLSALEASRRARLSESLQANIEKGQAISEDRLHAALEFQRWAREAMDSVFGSVDVVIGPAATGEAPRTLADTGDPAMQTIWTFTGTPALSVPAIRGGRSMPIGLQVTARRLRDAHVLGFAALLEAQGLTLTHEY